MYRYLLFYCPIYYPGGGMRDCEFKTDNLDELEPFININYKDELWGHIHYYDVVENKVYKAVMEDYVDENFYTRQRFVKWEEAN
jgi:hypothetical protein